MHIPEGGGRNFSQYSKGIFLSVVSKLDPNKLGYLTFYTGGLSTIKWSPTGGSVL